MHLTVLIAAVDHLEFAQNTFGDTSSGLCSLDSLPRVAV